MAPTKTATKMRKVYKVTTGFLEKSDGSDIRNWNSFTIIATDALDAIDKASTHFQGTEYAQEVECIAWLND